MEDRERSLIVACACQPDTQRLAQAASVRTRAECWSQLTAVQRLGVRLLKHSPRHRNLDLRCVVAASCCIDASSATLYCNCGIYKAARRISVDTETNANRRLTPTANRLSCCSAAGWSSLVARRAHNPKVAGSNPAPAIHKRPVIQMTGRLCFCQVARSTRSTRAMASRQSSRSQHRRRARCWTG